MGLKQRRLSRGLFYWGPKPPGWMPHNLMLLLRWNSWQMGKRYLGIRCPVRVSPPVMLAAIAALLFLESAPYLVRSGEIARCASTDCACGWFFCLMLFMQEARPYRPAAGRWPDTILASGQARAGVLQSCLALLAEGVCRGSRCTVSSVGLTLRAGLAPASHWSVAICHLQQ